MWWGGGWERDINTGLWQFSGKQKGWRAARHVPVWENKFLLLAADHSKIPEGKLKTADISDVYTESNSAHMTEPEMYFG